MTDTPRQVGPALVLTGMLLPWKGNQPLRLHMIGNGFPLSYIPLFDTEEQLRRELGKAGITFDSIKLVQDGHEFLDSIPPEIIVITNLWHTPEGRVQFQQVQR